MKLMFERAFKPRQENCLAIAFASYGLLITVTSTASSLNWKPSMEKSGQLDQNTQPSN